MDDMEKALGVAVTGFMVLMLGGVLVGVIAQYFVPIVAVVLVVGGGIYVLRNLPRWQRESKRAWEVQEEEASRAAALKAIVVEHDGVTNVAKRIVANLRRA